MSILNHFDNKIIGLLAFLATVLSGTADSNGPAGHTLTYTTQGTNAVVVVSSGTNSVTLVTQGTNAVVVVTQDIQPGLRLVAPLPPAGWSSLVAAGITFTRGNSDTILFTGKIATQKKDEHNEWLLQADGAYGENQSVMSEDGLHGLIQYNHLFSQKFYSYANADALHDGIQDLIYRVSLSPGAGYYFIKTKLASLSFEIGPGLITEKRGGEDETYMTLRMAEHWEQQINPLAKWWEKAEILPQATKFDNYTADLEIGIDTAITKQLSLQFVADDAYVNEPAAGRVNNDVKLIGGVAWKF